MWRGNPHHENDAHRSLPGLDTLAALAHVPSVRFISLQVGAEAAADWPPGLRLDTVPAPPLSDLAHTAALVSKLDLVIGVDTAVLHLAASLGTPTWMLLCHHKTDWRWMEDRSDTPWYPAMQLFRQRTRGHRAEVVDSVGAALRELTGEDDRRTPEGVSVHG